MQFVVFLWVGVVSEANSRAVPGDTYSRSATVPQLYQIVSWSFPHIFLCTSSASIHIFRPTRKTISPLSSPLQRLWNIHVILHVTTYWLSHILFRSKQSRIKPSNYRHCLILVQSDLGGTIKWPNRVLFTSIRPR